MNEPTDFVAYCCGKPMLKEKRGNHLYFRCSSQRHGRGFSMAIDPKEQSFCSCACGESPMQTKDFSLFRLFGGCQYCGARYSVFKEGAQLTFEVQGSDHKEVQEVTAEGIASIWDHFGFPQEKVHINKIFSKETLSEIIKSIKPDITVGVKVTKSHHISGDKNITESTIKKQEPKKEKGIWVLIKKISLVLTIIVSLIVIYGAYNRYIRKDKIDVSKVSNNYIFNFNAPVEIKNVGPQPDILKSPQIVPNQEEYFKYLPNGLKWDKDGMKMTNTSTELKKFFHFTKSNFTKTITGKQFKEMNSLLKQILSEEPDFAYAWFYRGLLFSFTSINPEFKDKFSSIAETSFKKADDLFNALLEKHPNDPFLLLYKGMNLTHLERAEESVFFLKKSLSLEPDIFQKKRVLGIIACWNHIAPNYLKEWQTAMDKY